MDPTQYTYNPYFATPTVPTPFQPDWGLSTLASEREIAQATRFTAPLGGDWSIIRHIAPEELAVDRLIEQAIALCDKGHGASPARLQGMFNPVLAYAQRREPMISLYYPNLCPTSLSSLIGYEWRALLPEFEKDYWRVLCEKAWMVYQVQYPHRVGLGSSSLSVSSRGDGQIHHPAQSSQHALDQGHIPQMITITPPFSNGRQQNDDGSHNIACQTTPPRNEGQLLSTPRDSRKSKSHTISPSRPPKAIPSLKSTAKRRKSTPRTMYEPNPMTYARNCSGTGGYSARPPYPRSSTHPVGTTLNTPTPRRPSHPTLPSMDQGVERQPTERSQPDVWSLPYDYNTMPTTADTLNPNLVAYSQVDFDHLPQTYSQPNLSYSSVSPTYLLGSYTFAPATMMADEILRTPPIGDGSQHWGWYIEEGLQPSQYTNHTT